MELLFEVWLDVERVYGKSASREDLLQAALEEIGSGLPSSLDVGESDYDVVGSSVDVVVDSTASGRAKRETKFVPEKRIRKAIRMLKNRRIITTPEDWQKFAAMLWEEESSARYWGGEVARMSNSDLARREAFLREIRRYLEEEFPGARIERTEVPRSGDSGFLVYIDDRPRLVVISTSSAEDYSPEAAVQPDEWMRRWNLAGLVRSLTAGHFVLITSEGLEVKQIASIT